MRQESFKMERPGLVKPGDKIQITEYQSYMNYSYIIEPAVAMSGCYPNSQRIKAKAVSYTHLDVYKRQLLKCAACEYTLPNRWLLEREERNSNDNNAGGVK